MKKVFIAIVVVLIGVVLYGAVILVNQKDPNNIVVRLGWQHQGQFAGFYVAQEKGFYKEVGLHVELRELDLDKDQIDELADGFVDVSVMEAHQALVGAAGGNDVKAVMAIYQNNPHVLAARHDSGINGPEDFVGRVIGLAGGEGEGNALFRAFVEKFGNGAFVTYKKLGFNTIDDFMNREADVIDLYKTDQIYLAQKEGLVLNIISLDSYGLVTYGDVVVVSGKYMTEYEDTVQKFVDATRRGWEYALANQEEAIDISLAYASGDYKDREYQRYIIEQSAPLIRGRQSVLGKMEFTPWNTLYESMRSASGIEAFDVRTIYTNQFVE